MKKKGRRYCYFDRLEHSGNNLRAATVQYASVHVLVLVLLEYKKQAHMCTCFTYVHDEMDMGVTNNSKRNRGRWLFS